MESNDMLSSLLSDPAKLQSAISMASSLLGGQGGTGSSPEPAPPAPSYQPASAHEPPAAPSFGPSFGAAAPGGGMGGYDPSAELMSKAMPVISAIARSGQTAISREKANLLNSLKPFVAENVGGQLDHAMRLVSIARMARSAMSQIGGASHDKNSGGNADDGTREL